jgi:hypothetical protein
VAKHFFCYKEIKTKILGLCYYSNNIVMPKKLNLPFILLHIYVLSYLTIIVMGAPDAVFFTLHLLAPIVAVSTLYLVLKSFGYSPTLKRS